MVRQPTFRSQQHKLQHENYKKLHSSNLPLISTSFDVSLSARNYESLQAMVKSGHLLAASQRSSLEFIFKALMGMVESCYFDFLQSQSVSSVQTNNNDLLKAELAENSSELSQLRNLFLLSQQQLQTSQTKENFYREQAQLFGACPSVRRREFDLSGKSDPQLLLRNTELTAVLNHNQTKLSMLQAENLCLQSALDALIASSTSQSADSVIMLEQTLSLSCAHQTIRDNIVLCELDNKRLADAVDSARSAPPLAPASLPERSESLSCQDLQSLFSQLDASSTFEFALPLSSAVIAALDDGIAERWQWSFMESELLSKIHAGRNGDPGDGFAEFERWYHFDYGSFAEHIPGRIPRSPSRLLHSVPGSGRV